MKEIIAYYLPQYHEVEENNKWWGEGFTEWTALEKSKKYISQQIIRKPTTLGYYDLSTNNIMEEQYALARRKGISAFCLWTYWFGNGDMLLEKPLNNILKEKTDVVYCIAWANHSWYNKTKGILLKEQKYLGDKDYIDFFNYMLPHFKQDNYFKVDGKPLVTIFDPSSIPDVESFVCLWKKLAIENGLEGVFFVGEQTSHSSLWVKHLDAFLDSSRMFENRNFFQKVKEKMVRRHNFTFLGPVVYDYTTMIGPLWTQNDNPVAKEIPVIFAGWDTTVRHGKKGVILKNFGMNEFRANVRGAVNYNDAQNLIFLKSWNEWAEGNTVEPDSVFGEKLLDIINEEVRISDE